MLGRGRRQAELVSGAGLSFLLKQASLPWCSESVTVCLSASISLALLSLLSSGLPSQGSEPLTLPLPSLPTAELAQEHLGELHQVSSWQWVGAAAELSSCVVSQASAGSCQRARRGQGSQMGPADRNRRNKERGENPQDVNHSQKLPSTEDLSWGWKTPFAFSA